MDLLVPVCFSAQYTSALRDLCSSFADIVHRFGLVHRGEMGSFVDTLMGFLVKFATMCPSRGLRELHRLEGEGSL